MGVPLRSLAARPFAIPASLCGVRSLVKRGHCQLSLGRAPVAGLRRITCYSSKWPHSVFRFQLPSDSSRIVGNPEVMVDRDSCNHFRLVRHPGCNPEAPLTGSGGGNSTCGGYVAKCFGTVAIPPLTLVNAHSSGLNSDWLFAELSSLREGDTSKQVLETRVRAQRVHPEVSP